MSQTSLFPNLSVDPEFDQNVERHQYRLEEIDIGDITFAAGQLEAVHRWYRLTPSFAPGLVRYFMREFAVTQDSLVLDPFSGRGTTAIECQKHSVRSVAFEINPILQGVGSHSLTWKRDHSEVLSTYLARLSERLKSLSGATIEDVARRLKVAIPDIHDVFRWWKPEVLRDLIVARSCASEEEFASMSHALWVALTSVSLDCANIHRNHPTITFDDNHGREIDAFAEMKKAVSDMIADLNSLTDAQIKASDMGTVLLDDACAPDLSALPTTAKFTHLITSPPYPNRYSYVHQTRPQLHFMEVLKTRGCATEIDLKAVGGTWGRATSNLMKALIEPPSHLRPALPYWDALSKKSVLMCNYATKYFIDMDRHVRAIRPALAPGATCAYVVGNSRLSGIEIYTETILARILEINGFSVDKIIVFRKRGGRKRLYETAVVARA